MRAGARIKSDSDVLGWLQAAFEEAGAAHPGVVRSYACVLHDLQLERTAGCNADDDIYPASVIKVPIMTEVFHRYAQGTLNRDTQVTIDACNQTATSGPAPFVPGYQTTVGEMVDFMIAHSDNVATNQLIDLLQRERVSETMHHLGLPTFLLGRKLSGSEPLILDPAQVGRNRLPAAEIATLLALIARHQVPGSNEQQRILASCVDNAKLAGGLAPGDVFMHKTGETSNVSHDAGILCTADGQRYIVVLYCQVEPTADDADATHANPFMAQWMRSVRRHL